MNTGCGWLKSICCFRTVTGYQLQDGSCDYAQNILFFPLLFCFFYCFSINPSIFSISNKHCYVVLMLLEFKEIIFLNAAKTSKGIHLFPV